MTERVMKYHNNNLLLCFHFSEDSPPWCHSTTNGATWKRKYMLVNVCSKYVNIKFSAHDAFRNIGRPNNLKVFGSNKPKGQNKGGIRGRCNENIIRDLMEKVRQCFIAMDLQLPLLQTCWK